MKKYLFFVFKVFLTVAILTMLIRLTRGEALQAAFRQMQPRFVWGAVALLPFNLGFQILRWHVLVQPLVRSAVWQSVRSVLGGYSLMLITPGRFGEAGRALFFKSDRKWLIAVMFVVDKAFASLTLLLFLCLSLAIWWGAHYWVLFAAVLLLCLSLLNHPQWVKWIFDRISQRIYHQNIPSTLTRIQFVLALCYSIFAFLVYALQYLLLINAFEPVSVRIGFIAFPLMMGINAFAITIGGLGIREAGAIVAFGLFDVARASALMASLLFYGLNVLLPGLLGIPILWMEGVGRMKAEGGRMKDEGGRMRDEG